MPADAPPAGGLAPGGRIGILGGGQLGRMIALAAADFGYRCHIFTPERDSPAAQVAAAATEADYADEAALAAFADAVDVVTLEFENIPVETVRFLDRRKPVRPGAEVLRITQDRLLEKRFAVAQGAGTAPFAPVGSAAELAAAAAAIPGRTVLKTRRFGYDGKGQAMVDDGPDRLDRLGAAWAALGRGECVLEGFVAFEKEVSVIVARGLDGSVAAFPAVENRHRHHILDLTLYPAEIAEATRRQAETIALNLARHLDLVGTVAVEMFVTAKGEVLVNELAPRVHNSGHWTIEACATSQFHQHVRAICGLPLGSPRPHSNAAMKNLIGEDARAFGRLVADPRNAVHLYGKTEIRAGRKMGHVTRLFPPGHPPEPFEI